MERQQQEQDRQTQHHLVSDFGMHDQARLTKRGRIHVLHTPRQCRRRSMVFAVDHVSDPAHCEADHCPGSAGVEDLPEGDV